MQDTFACWSRLKCNADGLVHCLSTVLKPMRIDDILQREKVLDVGQHPILVGCGTDGASVNVSARNGMQGKLKTFLPWLHWSWCYVHRLELACKDAFTSQLFHNIDEMLLRLYYLYENFQKV